jgi:hypothetical protein
MDRAHVPFAAGEPGQVTLPPYLPELAKALTGAGIEQVSGKKITRGDI